MALFLTEAVFQSSTYQGNYIDLLIEQSEIQSELLALNEAIYQADFIIHEKSRNLSEAAAMQLQEGFLGNVWEKVKAYVLKAWNWVKDFAKKIKDKIVEVYNRVKDRIKGDAVEIAKSKAANMEAAVTFIEQNAKLMEKLKGQTNETIVKSLKDQADKLGSDFDKKREANDKMTGTQKISFTYYEKLVKASEMSESTANAVARDFESELKAMEAKHAAELKDSQESTKIAQANSSRNAREADKKDSELDGAKSTISSLQAEIAAIKAAAALAMELARNAGAVATAAAAAPATSADAPADAPAKEEAKSSVRDLPTGATRAKPNAETRVKPNMNTRAKPNMNTRAKPNANTR